MENANRGACKGVLEHSNIPDIQEEDGVGNYGGETTLLT